MCVYAAQGDFPRDDSQRVREELPEWATSTFESKPSPLILFGGITCSQAEDVETVTNALRDHSKQEVLNTIVDYCQATVFVNAMRVFLPKAYRTDRFWIQIITDLPDAIIQELTKQLFNDENVSQDKVSLESLLGSPQCTYLHVTMSVAGEWTFHFADSIFNRYKPTYTHYRYSCSNDKVGSREQFHGKQEVCATRCYQQSQKFRFAEQSYRPCQGCCRLPAEDQSQLEGSLSMFPSNA